MNQPTSAPTNKIIAGALAGALTTILVWAIGYFAKVAIPPEVAAASTVILTFVTSYLVPEAAPAP